MGSTLPSILPGAVAGTARYAREGLVDWRVVGAATPLGVGAAVGGSLGSRAVPGDDHWLMVLTAVLVGFTAFRMLRPPEEDAAAPTLERGPVRLRAAGVGGRGPGCSPGCPGSAAASCWCRG